MKQGVIVFVEVFQLSYIGEFPGMNNPFKVTQQRVNWIHIFDKTIFLN